MVTSYYAHTAKKSDGTSVGIEDWQKLAKHLRNVAEIARQAAEPLGLADEAELAGLLHDLGKYSQRFQQRLK